MFLHINVEIYKCHFLMLLTSQTKCHSSCTGMPPQVSVVHTLKPQQMKLSALIIMFFIRLIFRQPYPYEIIQNIQYVAQVSSNYT